MNVLHQKICNIQMSVHYMCLNNHIEIIFDDIRYYVKRTYRRLFWSSCHCFSYVNTNMITSCWYNTICKIDPTSQSLPPCTMYMRLVSIKRTFYSVFSSAPLYLVFKVKYSSNIFLNLMLNIPSNFYSLKVVGRGSESQLQVVKNWNVQLTAPRFIPLFSTRAKY